MIKIDMEMPKSCNDCPIAYFEEDGYFFELRCPFCKLYVTDLDTERAEDCPLKE